MQQLQKMEECFRGEQNAVPVLTYTCRRRTKYYTSVNILMQPPDGPDIDVQARILYGRSILLTVTETRINKYVQAKLVFSSWSLQQHITEQI